MDNTPWTYTVSALQVRMLRIPVTESAAIRELRVFTTIDKQAAQSRGSKWKQERYSVEGEPSLQSTKKRGRRGRSPRRVERYRRSGLIEEAKWVRGDGKLLWTFPMEKFRRLKAYTPRIKAFVYGIGEAGVVNHSRTQAENLARQEKEGSILSFGWFFLDLRTPDLPERWLKLQNSPFGGEILITSTFSPMEISPTQSDMKAIDKIPNARGQRGAAAVSTMSTIISGESGEYLQIGNGQDVFVLSVFIQAALNIAKVVEISMGKNQQDLGETGFWLSYSLFDVIVQTDVFYNLSSAEFPPIRDSFRVKSNLKDMTDCISSLESLTVFLCTDNHVLAGVEIPLRPLLSNRLFAINEDTPRSGDKSEIKGDFSFPDFNEAVISASFSVELVEIKSSKSALAKQTDKANQAEDPDEATTEQDVHTDTSPAKGGVAPAEQILLKLDHLQLKLSILSPFIGKESISVEATLGEESISGDLVLCSYTKQQTFATCPALGIILENASDELAMSTPIHIRCYSSISKRLVAASAEVAKVDQDDKGYPKTIVLAMLNESKESAGKCVLSCTRGRDARQKLSESLSDVKGNKRHYRICLKLKSVRDVEISGGYSLRYQNPFLSSASSKYASYDKASSVRDDLPNGAAFSQLAVNGLQ
ncbi:Hypothetical protein PHPALM_20800 [Phytophthora palmivora]|uniref:DUF3668 domain-containing protein n=1 Tax=Phytophthora palmivora TaxID=4796 RepID=A0A2P4XDY3_9STRA|nr:Hypothetical protein PHPALM_20800 [Phytophthora palmivora]